MLRSPFAEFVPLPEVERHSDRIAIGQLGLPVGFDESQLLLNISGVERIATVAGLGFVSITGGEGKHDRESFTIGSLGSDGSIAAGSMRRVARASLDIPTATGPLDDEPQYYREKELRINTSAIADRIRDDGKRWKRGQLDPRAQAHYMNKGLQGALWHAGVESHRPRKDDLDLILVCLANYALAEFLGQGQVSSTTFFEAAGGGLLALQMIAQANDMSKKRKSIGELPPVVHAIIPGMAIERIPLTGAMAYSTRLMKAA